MRKGRPRGKALAPGTLTGGAEVLEVVNGGPLIETRYRIRYLCCDGETVMAHATLADRARKTLKNCPKCAALKERSGSSLAKVVRRAEEVGLPVIETIRGPRVRDARFVVRNPCCGEIQDLGLSAMQLRIKRSEARCRKCNARDNAEAAREGRTLRVPTPHPSEITWGPDWPKPPGVRGGAWCWGAR